MRYFRLLALTLVAWAVLFPASSVALAAGGNYVFQGGTSNEQQQVRDALQASSFNWSLVTEQITIDITPTMVSESVPGTIYLDPSLLDSGEWSWGVVQNEYANQVDFYLLPQSDEALFNTALGGTAWCYGDQPGLDMTQYGCERFASTLAWSYWQSPENCIQPADVGAEVEGMQPTAFRALLTSVLGPAAQPQPTAQTKARTLTSSKTTVQNLRRATARAR